MRARLKLEMMLHEHVHNALTPEERLQWIDQVIPIVLSSYEYIGGFKGANDPESLRRVLQREASKEGYWKLVVKDNVVRAAQFYRQSPHGLKVNLIATERSPEGKSALKELVTGDIRSREAWSELSSRALDYYHKSGWVPISAKKVKSMMPIGTEPDEEGFHTRAVAGVPYRKRGMATPRWARKHDEQA